LRSFTLALDQVWRDRSGRAELRSREERDVINFEAMHDALQVHGELHDAEAQAQQLGFSFRAEWDGIPALVTDLNDALASE
jgi:hypothetical protein